MLVRSRNDGETEIEREIKRLSKRYRVQREKQREKQIENQGEEKKQRETEEKILTMKNNSFSCPKNGVYVSIIFKYFQCYVLWIKNILGNQ